MSKLTCLPNNYVDFSDQIEFERSIIPKVLFDDALISKTSFSGLILSSPVRIQYIMFH